MDTEPKPGRCGAQLRKKPGQYCGRRPARGRSRCKLHGGAKGSGHPIQHGRRSKYIGHLLAEGYRDAIGSPRLLNLRETVAVQDAIVQRCLARLNESDTPDFRTRALALYNRHVNPSDGDDGDDANALARLGELLEAGCTEDRALRDVAEQNARLHDQIVEAWKIKLNKAQVMNSTDLASVFAWFVDMLIRTTAASPEVRAVQLLEIELRMPTAMQLQAAAGGEG